MKGFRWVVVLLVFLACLINFLDRSALAYVVSNLNTEYGINNQDFGLIAAAFGVSYLFMTIFGGFLIDSYGPKKILGFFAIIWSLASIGIGFASGFWQILFLRVILGAAEGPAFPALTRVCSDWLANHEKARAMSFSLVAVPFSSVIGAPLITQLILHFGWRNMFFILGSSGIVWSIIWFILFNNKASESQMVTAAEKDYIQKHQIKSHICKKQSFLELIQNRSLIISYVCYASLGYLVSFSMLWLPAFLQQIHSFEIAELGRFLIYPWLLASIMIIIGGHFADSRWKKTQCLKKSRAHIVIFSQLFSAFCLIPMLFTHSKLILGLSISFGLGFGLFPMACFFAINSDLASESAAKSQGLMSSFFGITGFLAPVITGYLSTKTQSFFIPILIVIMLSVFCAILMCFFEPSTNPRLNRLATEI